MTPQRIQRRRTAGWRMPEGAMSVTRPGPFGNPFKVRETAQQMGIITADAQELVCDWFRQWITQPTSDDSAHESGFGGHKAEHEAIHAALPKMRGKSLACWCRLCFEHRDGKPLSVQCDYCQPCHVDVLLELANAPLPDPTP